MTKHKDWLVAILTHDEPPELIQSCIQSVVISISHLVEAIPGTSAKLRIIDDSQSSNSKIWRPYADAVGAEYLYVSGSISQKRNSCWQNSRADVIVFIDADCYADPEWLHAHAVAYDTLNEIPGVIGITHHEINYSIRYQAAEYAGFLVGFRFPELMSYSYWGPCSNLSVRREILELVSGFDTANFKNAAEDVDLGLRIVEKFGKLFGCSSDAVVYHDPKVFADGLLRRAWLWGRGEASLLYGHSKFSIKAPPLSLIYQLTAAIIGVCGFFLHQLGWFVSVLLIYGFFAPLTEAHKNNKSIKTIYYSRLLLAAFQFRLLLQLLKDGRILLAIKKLNYGIGQMRYEWDRVVRSLWEFYLFILIGLLLAGGK